MFSLVLGWKGCWTYNWVAVEMSWQSYDLTVMAFDEQCGVRMYMSPTELTEGASYFCLQQRIASLGIWYEFAPGHLGFVFDMLSICLFWLGVIYTANNGRGSDRYRWISEHFLHTIFDDSAAIIPWTTWIYKFGTYTFNSLRLGDAKCVGKQFTIGSDSGLLPERSQATVLTNAGILLIGPT